jgi:hypothetical protein
MLPFILKIRKVYDFTVKEDLLNVKKMDSITFSSGPCPPRSFMDQISS